MTVDDTSYSLRRRLLWFLLAAIGVTALAQGAVAYRSARAEADDIFDYHMQQIALSMRNNSPAQDLADALAGDDGVDFSVQIWADNGLRIFRSPRANLPERAVLGFSNVTAGGTEYRLFSMATPARVIQVAQDMAVRRRMAGGLALRALVPTAAIAPLLMLVVWWVVGLSLAPVARVRAQVAARQPDDLTEVSEARLPDEIRPLVRELNLLFGRVRRAFDMQARFVADAAHELRTPLAALKLQVQGLQRHEGDVLADAAARAVAVQRLGAGIDRAGRLVEQLLVLARQQQQQGEGSVATMPLLDLAELVRLELAELAPLAQARRIDLGLGHADADCRVRGDADALRILLRNLVDNAIKYTPEGGAVDVALQRDGGGQVLLSVDDSGPGIAEDQRARAFDRFYRVPGAEAGGSGLGLAIVKAIADQHGAGVRLGHSASRGGLRAEVAFAAVGAAPIQQAG
jgi:two-component system OmpR family sensor kinase